MTTGFYFAVLLGAAHFGFRLISIIPYRTSSMHIIINKFLVINHPFLEQSYMSTGLKRKIDDLQNADGAPEDSSLAQSIEPGKQARQDDATDGFQRDFDRLNEGITLKLSKMKTVKEDLHAQRQGLSILLERFTSMDFGHSPEYKSINIGGQIYTNGTLNWLEPILFKDFTDLLWCLIHPFWSSYVVRDREGMVYIDMNIEWIVSLLDDLLDYNMPKQPGSMRQWRSYNVRGFRSLSVGDKLGYQVVRSYLGLHVAEEDCVHTPSHVMSELNMSSFSRNYFGIEFYPFILEKEKLRQSADCNVDMSMILDTQILHADVLTSFEQILKMFEQIKTDYFIIYVDKHPGDFDDILPVNSRSQTRLVLVHGPPQSHSVGTLIQFESDAVVCTGENYCPDVLHIVAEGKSDSDYRLNIRSYRHASLSWVDVNILRDGNGGVSDRFSIKMVAAYPIIHEQIQLARYDDVLSSLLMEDEEEETYNKNCTEFEHEVDTISHTLWEGFMADCRNLKSSHKKWMRKIQTDEHNILLYSEFMKEYLFRCHGQPVPKVALDNHIADGYNDMDDPLFPGILGNINGNLQAIATHCPKYLSSSNKDNQSSSSSSSNLNPIVYINVSGLKLSVLRESVLRCFPDSQLAIRVSGRWLEQEIDGDEDGYIIYDLPKRPFKALVDYIRLFAMKPKMAKLFIGQEDEEDLQTTCNYLSISLESIPIVIV